MLILPAIDLYEGRAVRLLRGDYAQMTVYSNRPLEVARGFAVQGAEWLHLVDLEGARDGGTPNLRTILQIKQETGLSCEAGGGIRDMGTIARCLEAGVDRVILGTAATAGVAEEAVREFGERVAVGVDVRDGRAAVRGWMEDSGLEAMELCRRMGEAGVQTLICTDISRDGAMRGANLELYRELQRHFPGRIIASGGVSSLEDVRRLAGLRLHGAIIGKACYIGAVDLGEAILLAREVAR